MLPTRLRLLSAQPAGNTVDSAVEWVSAVWVGSYHGVATAS